MSQSKGVQTWRTRSGTLSRIWVCSRCGVKIFYGRLVAEPTYGCLCGETGWRRFDRACGDNVCTSRPSVYIAPRDQDIDKLLH